MERTQSAGLRRRIQTHICHMPRKDSYAVKRSLNGVRGIGQTRFSNTNRLEGFGAGEAWPASQRRARDEGLAEFLTAVLQEWIVRNPGKSLDDTNLAAILPEALDEFIWKHLGDS